MTERAGNGTAQWARILKDVSRSSGHELRNALNALVVNLEVVRSRSTDPSIQQFVEQSVSQSEESVRLTESLIALLNVVVDSIGPDGVVQCSLVDAGGVRIETSPGEAERAARSLRALADRAGMTVDVSGSAVILSPSETARDL